VSVGKWNNIRQDTSSSEDEDLPLAKLKDEACEDDLALTQIRMQQLLNGDNGHQHEKKN